MLVNVGGWLPSGVEVKIRLPDEPGTRAVQAVQLFEGKDQKLVKDVERLPFVAVSLHLLLSRISRHRAMPSKLNTVVTENMYFMKF